MDIDDDLHKLTFHLSRSGRYHAMRWHFFAMLALVLSVTSISCAMISVVTLLAAAPLGFPVTFGVAGIIAQVMQHHVNPAAKADAHQRLHTMFSVMHGTLVNWLPDVDANDLRDMREEVRQIELMEPPIKRYLDLIAHNQAAIAIGSDDIEKLRWWQRLLAQYLPGDDALQR